MSVLRGEASDEEFRRVIELRRRTADHRFLGVTSLPCGSVRRRSWTYGTRLRPWHRFFYVLDTDLPDSPSHADIFSTKAKDEPEEVSRARRERRGRLLGLMLDRMVEPAEFRNGRLTE